MDNEWKKIEENEKEKEKFKEYCNVKLCIENYLFYFSVIDFQKLFTIHNENEKEKEKEEEGEAGRENEKEMKEQRVMTEEHREKIEKKAYEIYQDFISPTAEYLINIDDEIQTPLHLKFVSLVFSNFNPFIFSTQNVTHFIITYEYYFCKKYTYYYLLLLLLLLCTYYYHLLLFSTYYYHHVLFIHCELFYYAISMHLLLLLLLLL
jgi:hypothetical protein